MTKTKTKQEVTPFGRAGFCRLIRPSFKFDPDAGEFNAQLILPPADAAPLIELLDRLYEQAYQDNLSAQNAERAQKGKVPLTEIKRADKPYRHVEDPDTGEKLPDFRFNFRLKYRRIGKNEETGQKEVFGTRTPLVVDSKGNPVRQDVGAGSIIRVSFVPNGFFTAALGSGLSLRLIGVQVKELVQPGMERAEFGQVDGYEVSPTAASSAPSTPAQPDAVGEGEADDVDY